MKIKNRLFVGALGFLALTLTSCNRGIGCPSDFSLDVDISSVLSQIISILPL